MKSDLYTLNLVDGLPSRVGEKKVAYRTVKLRETNVGDELAAVQLAERVVTLNGKPTLLMSDEVYRVALTMRHIERFVTAGLDDIGQDILTIEMMGRLSKHDFDLIEERCLMIGLAAQVRYGGLSQTDFDKIMAGKKNDSAPRSEGQSDGLGKTDSDDRAGPQLLSDNTVQRTKVPSDVLVEDTQYPA